MMKNILFLFAIMILTCVLAGCGSNSATSNSATSVEIRFVVDDSFSYHTKALFIRDYLISDAEDSYLENALRERINLLNGGTINGFLPAGLAELEEKMRNRLTSGNMTGTYRDFSINVPQGKILYVHIGAMWADGTLSSWFEKVKVHNADEEIRLTRNRKGFWAI